MWQMCGFLSRSTLAGAACLPVPFPVTAPPIFCVCFARILNYPNDDHAIFRSPMSGADMMVHTIRWFNKVSVWTSYGKEGGGTGANDPLLWCVCTHMCAHGVCALLFGST